MGYTICEMDPEKDKETILAFWNRHHDRPLDSKIEWMYLGNPAGKAIVWMARHDESGEWVGIRSLFPRVFSVNGRTLRGGISGDIFVIPEHRALGPALKLNKAALSAVKKGVVGFVYGFPNKSAEPVLKRSGSELLGPLVRLVKVIRTAPILGRRGWPHWAVHLVSPILDLGLRILSWATWPRSKGEQKRMEFRQVDRIEEAQFKDFSTKLASRFVVMGDRTSQYLNWKFLKDPDDNNLFFLAFDSEIGAVKGYIVYCCQDNAVEIRDFGLCGGDVLDSTFIAAFLRHVRSLRPESIIVQLLENKRLQACLDKFGFRKGNNDRNVYLYVGDNAFSNEDLNSLKDPAAWFLMCSDQDT